MHKYLLFILIHSTAGLFLSAGLTAQTQYQQFTDDSLYFKALDMAESGKTENARIMAMALYNRSPHYHDAAVMVARMYAWEKKYDLARNFVSLVTEVKPSYYDALSLLADIETWSGNHKLAKETASYALSFYPEDEGFLVKKARAFINQGMNREAEEILNQVLGINPDNKAAKEMLENMTAPGFYHYRENHYVLTGYSGDYFNTPYKRRLHIGTVGYSHYTGIGPVTAKVNFGNTYISGAGLTRYPSLQYELESYPKLTPKIYLLLNYAWSPDIIFPGHRAAFEVFGALPSGFEASAGLRFMHWNKSYFFYTGSAGKYYGDMWFSLRPYVFPVDNSIIASWYFTSRKYFSTADDYIGVVIGFGLSPDDNLFDPAERDFLNATGAGLEYSAVITSHLMIRGGLRFEYEEYKASSSYRTRWLFNTGIRYYF